MVGSLTYQFKVFLERDLFKGVLFKMDLIHGSGPSMYMVHIPTSAKLSDTADNSAITEIM